MNRPYTIVAGPDYSEQAPIEAKLFQNEGKAGLPRRGDVGATGLRLGAFALRLKAFWRRAGRRAGWSPSAAIRC